MGTNRLGLAFVGDAKWRSRPAADALSRRASVMDWSELHFFVRVAATSRQAAATYFGAALRQSAFAFFAASRESLFALLAAPNASLCALPFKSLAALTAAVWSSLAFFTAAEYVELHCFTASACGDVFGAGWLLFLV